MAGRRCKLEPTLYQVSLVDYLRSEERDLWSWFASEEARNQYVEALRSGLRQRTQPLENGNEARLLEAAEAAKAALDLSLPLRLHQARPASAERFNASLCYIPEEIHLVLSGALDSLPEPEELKTILGHELAHYLLWERDGGQFLVADRILQAITDDPRATPSHHQSARRYRQYAEIYADRGALVVVEDLPTAVAALAKAETGTRRVNADSYLKKKALPRAKLKSGRRAHPEMLLRAQALRLWAEGAEELDAQLAAMIEALDSPEALDLLAQARYTRLTRRLLGQLLRPPWFQTKATLAQARKYFKDYQPAAGEDPGLVKALRVEESRLREYLAYVLLDFAVADPQLADLPLAAVWDWARKLNMDPELKRLLAKELKLKPRELKVLQRDFKERLKQAEVSAADCGTRVE